jgi:hypothetical protein
MGLTCGAEGQATDAEFDIQPVWDVDYYLVGKF